MTILKRIERLGNKLPDMSVLFLIATVSVMALSYVLSGIDFNYIHPVTHETIRINNLLTIDALLNFIILWPKNYAMFPPLAAVVVITIGIGLLDGGGMLRVLLKYAMGFTPKKLLTPMIVFISILCHTIADASYMFLMPTSALAFYLSGRHPMAGVAAAFAGLAGGFSSGFTLSFVDPIIQGLTQNAAQFIDESYTVNVLANYYYSFFSGFLVILGCWWVTDYYVEPYLQRNLPVDIRDEDRQSLESIDISGEEKRALFSSLSLLLLMSLILIVLCIPETSIMRSENGSLTDKDAPLMKMIIPLMFLFAAIPGWFHGFVSGRFRDSKQTMRIVGESVSSITGFLIFVFFAAQFLYVFKESNIGILLAISGGDFLKEMDAKPWATVLGVMLLTASLNLIITSAITKWSFLAPVVVPMLMKVGVSPEFTQAGYRVSDSVLNIITPMCIYYPLIINYVNRYCKTAGMGTLVSVMIPYSIVLTVLLVTSLYIFWIFNIPLGVGAVYNYPR